MKDLIYNQTQIPKEQWRYGLRSSSATGCGWIATYNALKLMGYHMDPEKIIRRYERMLPVLHGTTGTVAFAPAACFRKWGFPVELIFARNRFDECVRQADACILFYYWRNRFKVGAHFVALHHTDQGFIGYNTYKTSDGPDFYGDSLEAFLKKRGYFGTVLLTIQDKRKKKS